MNMLTEIIKNIHIPNPESVGRLIMRDDYFLTQMMLGRLVRAVARADAKGQKYSLIGGGEPKIIGMTFEGYTFKLYHQENHEGHDLSIKRYNAEVTQPMTLVMGFPIGFRVLGTLC